MAQPPEYERQYDFEGYQSSFPSQPLPGNQIDIELDEVKQTLDALNYNIALIQRDDGAVANKTIGIDQAATDLIALIGSETFVVNGDWTTATEYLLGDLVKFADDGATYLCIENHTSGTFTTDRDTNGYWFLFANPPNAAGAILFDAFDGTGAQTDFTPSPIVTGKQR